MNPSTNTLNQRLERLHKEVRGYFPFVARIAVALYEPKTDDIKTFLYSPAEGSPLQYYATKLASATWLDDLRRSRRSRVIDDMDPAVLGDQYHSRRIAAANFKSSYTVPVFDEVEFLGFVFFDSDRPGVFSERVTRQLDLFVRIISLMVENALQSVSILAGGLQLLREISRFRDDETASHLSRMSHYSELVARQLAPELQRDDDWAHYVRLFAPLHDIGKVTTPDSILFKPGKLNDAEFEVMKQHTVKGAEILVTMIEHLSLEQVPHIQGLLHIARHHHERWDGTGYPDGLAGEQIATEARIVAVADAFDALTSRRCYKEAWPVARAEAYLRENSGAQFDPRCVAALVGRRDEVLGIMARFADESSEAT